MDPAQGCYEFVTYLPSKRPRLHEAKVVGIGGRSPTYETRLLGDEAEMLLIAVTRRLGNRKGAFIDMFRLAFGRCA